MNDDLFHFSTGPCPDIRIGDCLELLIAIPDNSVDCCVTSPPYFGLRDYGTGTWNGGDPHCTHRVGGQVMDSKAPGAISSGIRPGADASRCRDCGALRTDQQLGIEPTPRMYVDKLVEVFQHIKRILKPTGVLFLNLGDSYSNDDKWGGYTGGKHAHDLHGATGIGRHKVYTGLKPKDLIGIPWECAFALRASGWYLRSDIIWEKGNQMPESVKDRVTKSHEYVFMFSKSKLYYFDADAIAEPAIGGHVRNRRSVWSINTKPYSGAHFATMPIELAELCIKAGTSKHGCCSRCGAPWRRLAPRVAELSTPSGAAVWEASCGCNEHSIIAASVIDPFGGAGTTGLVAQRLGRQSILIELNPLYAELARLRIASE
jgi:DNA modification methylase